RRLAGLAFGALVLGELLDESRDLVLARARRLELLQLAEVALVHLDEPLDGVGRPAVGARRQVVEYGNATRIEVGLELGRGVAEQLHVEHGRGTIAFLVR